MRNVHGGDIYNYKDMIDFSANINPLGLPRGVRMALIDSIDKTIHYPDMHCEELREKLGLAYGIEKESILCGNGAADLIFSITVGLKPRKALILSPTFAEYEQALRAVRTKISYYRLKEENGFQLKEDFLSRITKELDMVFLCNPNNPTGEIIPKTLLLELIKKCQENHVIVVIDECFNSFLEQGEEISVIKETKSYDNLIVVNAFTKLYAMPGIRLGFGVIHNKQIRDTIQKSSQPWNVSLLAQEAGVAALEEQEYVIKSKELINKERNYLTQEIEKIGYKIYGSKANYIFFKAEDDLFERCLKHHILIRDCSNYHGLEKGYYRIAVRTHEDNKKLIEAFQSERK